MTRLLSATLTVLAFFSTGLSQTSTASADADFFRGSSDSLIQSLHLSSLDQSSPFGQQVFSLLRSFPGRTAQLPGLWVCHGCGTSSHPVLGIILDPDQIDSLRSRSGVDSTAFLTFILAHEMAHQLQYSRYGKALFLRPAVELQFYEAQADLIAGEALFTSYPDAAVTAQSGLLYRMLLAIYDLGGEQFALADHPSKNGRFLAARIGMQRALVDETRSGVLPGSSGQADGIAQQIDLRPSEDDLAFSLRMAKQITQYNPIAAKDLAYVSSPNDINFHPDSADHTVDYSFRYENHGTHTLAVSLQVQCIAVLRTDPENFLRSLEASANVHVFSIAPGTAQQVQGTLHWVGDDDMMPRMIYPPSPFILLEVHYADNSDVSTEVATAPNKAGLGDVPSAGQLDSFAVGLQKLTGLATHGGYQQLIAGLATQYGQSASYPSNDPLPGALDATVSVPNDPSKNQGTLHTTSTFLRTNDAAAAKTEFDNLVILTRATLPNVPVPYGLRKWEETPGADMEEGFRFTHDPFDIVIQDNVLDQPTGTDQDVVSHEIQLTFSGIGPTNPGPGTPTSLDGMMANFLRFADQRALATLKAGVDISGQVPDPTDTDTMWQLKVAPPGLNDCSLTQYPTYWQLSCDQSAPSRDAANAFAEQLKAAAINSGAMMQNDRTDTRYRTLDIVSHKGSALRITVGTDKKGGGSVDVLLAEPEP